MADQRAGQGQGGGKRNDVTVEMEVSDTKGKMWDFRMVYHDLPEDNDGGVVELMGTLADYIKNHPGQAQSGEPSYTVAFRSTSTGGKKAEAKQTNLRYSQVIEAQSAGTKMLQDLVQFGQSQVKSGARK